MRGIPLEENSGDDEAFKALVSLMKARKATLPFRIVSDDYDAAVSGLVSSGSHRLALILQKASAQAEVPLDFSRVTYTTDKEASGMDVFVVYQ